jgi:hypothetical protein
MKFDDADVEVSAFVAGAGAHVALVDLERVAPAPL